MLFFLQGRVDADTSPSLSFPSHAQLNVDLNVKLGLKLLVRHRTANFSLKLGLVRWESTLPTRSWCPC